MSHHTLEMKQVSYLYPDGTAALTDVSFRLTHGESVALIGANGAGKSTLLSMLVGIIMPFSGEVRVGERPLNEKSIREIRRRVGIVLQNPDDQLFMPTVFDDVAFGPLHHGVNPAELPEIVDAALEIVGAQHLRMRSPHRLSLGEKRAVAIAAVLAMEPDILVMDEPSSGLDPWSRRQLIRLLGKFKHTRVIATHDLDLALDVCERTIMIKNGRLVADGATHDILRDKELLHSCRMEMPLRFHGCPVCGVLPSSQKA